jgi:Ca2+-binding RTX toxin-like protein
LSVVDAAALTTSAYSDFSTFMSGDVVTFGGLQTNHFVTSDIDNDGWAELFTISDNSVDVHFFHSSNGQTQVYPLDLSVFELGMSVGAPDFGSIFESNSEKVPDGFMSSSITMGYIDNDRDIDIVISDDLFGGSIRTFLNEGINEAGALTWNEATPITNPFSVDIDELGGISLSEKYQDLLDYDHDGDLDFITLGNLLDSYPFFAMELDANIYRNDAGDYVHMERELGVTQVLVAEDSDSNGYLPSDSWTKHITDSSVLPSFDYGVNEWGYAFATNGHGTHLYFPGDLEVQMDPFILPSTAQSTSVTVLRQNVNGSDYYKVLVSNFDQPSKVYTVMPKYDEETNSFDASFTETSIGFGNTNRLLFYDFDRDGDYDDILALNDGRNAIYINEDGNYTDYGFLVGSDNKDTVDVTFFDFNDDGQLDLVEGNYNETDHIFVGKGQAQSLWDYNAYLRSETWAESITDSSVSQLGSATVYTFVTDGQGTYVYLLDHDLNVMDHISLPSTTQSTKVTTSMVDQSSGKFDVLVSNFDQPSKVYNLKMHHLEIVREGVREGVTILEDLTVSPHSFSIDQTNFDKLPGAEAQTIATMALTHNDFVAPQNANIYGTFYSESGTYELAMYQDTQTSYKAYAVELSDGAYILTTGASAKDFTVSFSEFLQYPKSVVGSIATTALTHNGFVAPQNANIYNLGVDDGIEGPAGISGETAVSGHFAIYQDTQNSYKAYAVELSDGAYIVTTAYPNENDLIIKDFDSFSGPDLVFVGTQNADELMMNTGYNEAYLGPGDDKVTAGDGGSWINAGAGDDEITGGAGQDKIVADNLFSSETGADFVKSGGGDDVIFVQGSTAFNSSYAAVNISSSTQVGTGENFNLNGMVKVEDVIDGGADVDTIQLGEGNIALFLHDSFSGFHASVALTMNSRGEEGVARLANIEKIMGNDSELNLIDLTSTDYSLAGQAITIDGAGGSDIIWGSDADEIIIGGDGNDELFGGAGDDTLTGGTGHDTFQFTATSGADTISDFTVSDQDILEFYYRSGNTCDINDLALKDGVINWSTGDEDRMVYIDLSATISSNDISDYNDLISFVEIV